MKYNDMEQLKKEYMDTPIPKELEFVVKKALEKSESRVVDRKNFSKGFRIVAASAAACIVITITGINSSQVFAKTMSKLPVIGGIVKVLTFREYAVNEDNFKADIKVPAVQGLKDKNLENSLNEKYLSENKKLYEQFMEDMQTLKKNGGGNLGVNSGYVVKTDSDSILSVGRYVVNTVGSSSTVFKYDTIDKKNGVLISLPSLFKDDRYVDIISENIKKQMIEQHKADNNKFYWVDGIKQNGSMELFKKISKDQNFYINSEGKLVISFNKYEVAPGYMGIVEFVIPTEILSDDLVGNGYIK